MRRRSVFGALIVALFLADAVMATDPPDARYNPGTGFIEIVESVWNGSDYDVRHVEDPPSGPSTITTLADAGDDEREPRIAIDTDKNTWVAYWQDGATDTVLLRFHDFSTSTWDDEVQVSATGDDARAPSLGTEGTLAHLAYEISLGGTTGVEASRIDEGAEPVGRTLIATTPFAGDLDVTMQVESGHVWVSWVDSGDDVGWAEYDATLETWSAVQLEDYSSDHVLLARKRIRTTVLAP